MRKCKERYLKSFNFKRESFKNKSSKRNKGGIFLLLIRNYIFFSIVVLMVGILISYISGVVFYKKFDIPMGLNDNDKKILAEEKFNKLDLKSIVGRDGIIDILDQNKNIIYTSSKENNTNEKVYTEKELTIIPNYDDYGIDTKLYEFKGEDNKWYKLLISTPYKYDEEIGVDYDSDNSWFKILDDELKVIYELGNNPDDSMSYTEEEVGYLIGEYPREYILMKYNYVNNDGSLRTAIIKSKRIDDEIIFKKFSQAANISLWLFLLTCILCIIIFGAFLKRKVQKPLNKLNKAMQLLSEGIDDEPINYSGPKEFVEICDSFNIMVNKLESSEKERNKLIKDKQSMLADISHDLKTPITTIQGYAKALADGVISPEEYEKYFNIIYAKSKRLTELINIFYEYSKLDHPDFKLVFENVDLAEYLRAYVASKYEDILESGFDIEVDIPEKVLECKIDKIQFQRVLDNLLGNAMKHNPVGTKIYVALNIVKNGYKIVIADNGVGIPKDIKDDIFSPFTVGDESRNTKQGSGLGLAITKTIVEMHGGSIKLDTTMNKEYRTIFEIEISK